MKEEGRVEFLRKNIVYEDDANVTCQSEKGLILYEAYVEGGDTLYLVDDMTVSEDIIIPKDTVIDAGQYKMILTAGYSITAYQDLSGIIQVPAGYRLAVSGNETDGFTYTAEKKSSAEITSHPSILAKSFSLVLEILKHSSKLNPSFL